MQTQQRKAPGSGWLIQPLDFLALGDSVPPCSLLVYTWMLMPIQRLFLILCTPFYTTSFTSFFGEFSQILVWALCKRAWKQAACLSDLGDLGLCLKLLFWKDQGRDWFDIKRTAESGTLLNTQWAKHLYCIHTQHKINYTCAVAESNTIKILAGPCFVEKRQTCIFNVAAAVQVSKKNWIFNLENNLVWLYFCMYCMYFVCHTVSNLTSRAIVFLSKTKPFSIFQKYFIWYWSRYKEIKEHGFILQDVGMKL